MSDNTEVKYELEGKLCEKLLEIDNAVTDFINAILDYDEKHKALFATLSELGEDIAEHRAKIQKKYMEFEALSH